MRGQAHGCVRTHWVVCICAYWVCEQLWVVARGVAARTRGGTASGRGRRQQDRGKSRWRVRENGARTLTGSLFSHRPKRG